jgi:hypothetical protein
VTDENGLPWWFKQSVGAMIAFVLLFTVLALRAWRQTRATKAYAATQGWTYRCPDRKLAETSLPDLDLLREGAFSRAMGKVLNYDIQLESEEFNRAYTARSDDRNLASSVLHPQMLEQLLRGAPDSWSIRNGDLLDLDNWNGRPGHFTARLDDLIGVLQGIPDFVWQDHRGRPEQLKQGVS